MKPIKLTYKELIEDKIFKNAVETFLRLEDISDIVLLGKEGGIRRIIFGDSDSLLADLRDDIKEVRKRYSKKESSK